MRRAAHALLLAGAVLAAGCGTIAPRPGDPGIDPWEGWNRKVYAFNEALDETVVKPVAIRYSEILPSFVRTGIGNVFANVGDGWSAINNLLQGKPTPAIQDVVRFSTNTFLGFGGLLDIAGEAGIPRHHEDFGQTLATWGVGAGPYLVLPLFGPSTVRDGAALPMDLYFSPALLVDHWPQRLAIGSLNVVDTRARLLGTTRLLEDVALDRYVFVRDAWLQRRRSLVLGGDADAEQEDDFEYAPPSEPEAPAAPAPAGPRP